MYWSALILGFFGSTHCVLMCGPIVVSLTGQKTLSKFLTSRLIYNLGRISTYILLGVFFGFFGEVIAVTQIQQIFSVFIGVIICLMAFVFFSRYIESKLAVFANSIIRKIKTSSKLTINKSSLLSSWISGTLNGLLPCGLVYIALTAALATSSILSGAVFMLSFGLGTFPAMLIIALIGKISRPTYFTYFSKLSAVFTFVLGTMLIIRGLGLSIPYLSPVIGFLYPTFSEPIICY